MYKNYNMPNNYYGYNRQPNQTNGYNEIITLTEAINLIRQSIEDEKEDEMFYNKLLKQAKTNNEKEIITSIRNDEIKHNQILKEIYYNFTGQIVKPTNYIPNMNTSLSYKDNLEKALFGELKAVTKYRKILGTMPSGNNYILLMSIMTDELTHANKYNYLIANNK